MSNNQELFSESLIKLLAAAVYTVSWRLYTMSIIHLCMFHSLIGNVNLDLIKGRLKTL